LYDLSNVVIFNDMFMTPNLGFKVTVNFSRASISKRCIYIDQLAYPPM